MIDRGQTLLVGAIALAVLFVSLALVLNTAIYGSTIASQGSEDVTGGQTIALQSAVERDVGFLIERATRTHTGDLSAQTSLVESEVTEVDARYRQYYAENDRIVGIDTDSADDSVNGTEIYRDTGQFDSGTLVTNGKIRKFSIEPDTISSTSTFSIIFRDGPDEWELEIEDGGSGDFQVTLDEPDGVTRTCSEPGPINVTEGTLGGTRCNALDFFEQLSGSYNLEYQDGDQITGGYSLITNGTVSAAANSRDALYAVDVTLSERSTRVDYDNTIRVAPGEPR